MTTPGGARRRSGGGVTLLVLNEANISRLFNSEGLVGRFFRQINREIEPLAKANVVRKDRGYQTGRTAASIKSSVTKIGPKQTISNVRATTAWAYWYHQGTPRHVIIPNNSHGWLAIPRSHWLTYGGGLREKGGKILIKGHVTHPGFKGNPFLHDAMRTVLRTRRLL